MTNYLTRVPKITSEMLESAWANIRFFRYQIDPELRRLVRRLERLHLMILKKKQSVVFNQICLDNNLLPKYTISLSLSLSLAIYIYIYIYLRIYYLPAFTVTKKKKKKRQNSEITISRITAREKKKKIIGRKKRKGQLRYTSWKKSRDMQSVGQKNKNPLQNAAMPQLQKVLNTK